MTSNKHIAKCGVNCAGCSAFKDNIKNDDNYIRETIDGFLKYHDQHIGELYCDGCHVEDCDSPKHLNAGCKVRKCATEMGVENCGYCNKYPCNEMKKVFKVIEIIIDRINTTSANREEDYKKFVVPYLNKKRLDYINYKHRLKNK